MRKVRKKRAKKHFDIGSMSDMRVSKLIALLEEWTRYEIAARLLPIQTKLAVDYYRRMLDKENEIRVLLYGQSGLNQLARLFNMDRSECDVKVRRSGELRIRCNEEEDEDEYEGGDVDNIIEQLAREAGV